MTAIKKQPEVNQCMRRDAAELLYGNSVAGIFVTVFASTMLVFGFKNPLVEEFKFVWWLSLMFIMTLRAADAVHWRVRYLGTDYNGRTSMYRYLFGTQLTALMWCIYSLGIFKYSDSIELASTIIIVSSMAGGAATILAANKYAAMAYVFTLLAPFSLMLILASEEYQQILGVLGASFCVVMLFTSKKSADFTANAIRLKNENVELVHHMESQVESRTRKIYKLSNLDPLTGLFNRTAFLAHLEEQLSAAKTGKQPLAVLFIDLDGFKKINDAIGHETGDQVLMRTAKRLKRFCAGEHLLCRWGGDEFIVSLRNTSELSAMDQARQIIEHISEEYLFSNNRLLVGATIGIAMFPDHSRDAAMLIRLADTAMYHQKKLATSNAFVFSEQLGKRISREHRLKDGLAQALGNRQLRLVYQPIVDSQSGQVMAFEALLRWRFGWENLSPVEFIAIAEQYGMIQKIGTWVLESACTMACSWDRDKNIAVCVNVSIIQLQDEGFIEIVRRALANSGLPANLLHIEITETVFASDTKMLFNQINMLQSLGIKVSIDDFGTGYSSLSAMQDLAVDVVKIDSSFVDHLETSGAAIIDAVMNISSSLNYQVIAEGVETLAQSETLADLGVHFLQGYHFAKPMESDQIGGYLEHANTRAGPVLH